jgi:hypothetical protein
MSSTHPHLLPVFFCTSIKKHPVYFSNWSRWTIFRLILFDKELGVFILLERLIRLLPRKITTFFVDTIFINPKNFCY